MTPAKDAVRAAALVYLRKASACQSLDHLSSEGRERIFADTREILSAAAPFLGVPTRDEVAKIIDPVAWQMQPESYGLGRPQPDAGERIHPRRYRCRKQFNYCPCRCRKGNTLKCPKLLNL